MVIAVSCAGLRLILSIMEFLRFTCFYLTAIRRVDSYTGYSRRIFNPPDKLRVKNRLAIWKMMNERIQNHGPLPPMKKCLNTKHRTFIANKKEE